MNMIAVKQIEKETSNKSVTVKILRSWVPTDAQKKPVAIEAIVMDAQGTQIPVYVKRAFIAHFKKDLNEDETVVINHFAVDDNTPHKYQKARVQHPFKIVATYVTSIVRCKPDLQIMSRGFNLIPFDDIPSFNSSFYIDVIGRVTKRGEIEVVEKINARMLEVEVQDERNTKLKFVLWESYADKLMEYIPNAEVMEDGIVILLQFAHKSVFKEDLRIQTTFHATKMMINGNIPEFEEFNLKRKELGSSSICRSITFLSEARSLKPEEWLNLDNHKTIQDIKTSSESGSYIVFVQFINIDSSGTWYYNACGKCNSMVKDANVGEICPAAKCRQIIESIVPRFRVKVIATNGVTSDEITLVLFEEIVANLIGKSALTVMESVLEYGDLQTFPMEFKPMMLRKFLARVKISREFNIAKGSKEFGVEFLTEDEDILSQYGNNALMEVMSNADGSTSLEISDKGKGKLIDDGQQDSTTEFEENITPMKRSLPIDLELEDDCGLTVNSSTKVSIKKEKMK